MAKIRLQTRYTLLCYIIQFTASWFECHIENSNLRCRDWCKKTSARKILCKAIVWCTNWKYHLFCMRTHRFLFVWQISFACLPHFLCKIENSPCFWPSCIKCDMCVLLRQSLFVLHHDFLHFEDDILKKNL